MSDIKNVVDNEVNEVTQVVDQEEEKVQEVVNGDQEDDDNQLVTAEDLKDDETDVPKITSQWDNPELIESLTKQMEALGKARFKKVEFTEAILVQAMAEVLTDLGWKDHTSFRETVNEILRGPRNGPNRVPFSLKTRNQRTGRMDFWLVRSFVKVDGENEKFEYSDEDGNVISKKTVLMSRQFSNFLRDYCRTQLKDEVQFWVFTGSYKGKQHLILDKLIPSDKAMLPDQNPNNLVMIQFKMKTPEEMIGAKRA